MRIGIDFDNTISNYDECFKFLAKKYNYIEADNTKVTKKEIKSKILKESNGIKKWMTIQGLAYGKYINKANLNQDFLRFLSILRSRNYIIYIISHKTEFGHFDDKKISLRSSALRWMRNKKILNKITGIKKSNIFFANTREEKISIVNRLKCNYFIDDLKEVLNHKNFPKQTKKILFSNKHNKNLITFSNWNDISKVFFNNFNARDIYYLTYSFHKDRIKKIDLIRNLGNSNNFRLEFNNKKKYFIKIYPSLIHDKRQRLNNEYKALQFLCSFKKFNLAKPIVQNKQLNFSVFEYINGKKIYKPSNNDINSVINFIKNLSKISKDYKNSKKFGLASEVSVNLSDLIVEISKRKKKIDKFLKKIISKKLNKDLDNIWNKMKSIENNYLIKSNINHFILSPSDIGFHNIIKKNKKLYFLDFEYFGWDDPIKIASDFIIHPQNQLSYNQILNWIKKLKKVFNNIDEFDKKFKLFFPFYLFRWILIIMGKEIKEINQLNLDFINNNHQSNKIIKINRLILIKNYVKILKKINLEESIDLGEFVVVKNIKK